MHFDDAKTSHVSAFVMCMVLLFPFTVYITNDLQQPRHMCFVYVISDMNLYYVHLESRIFMSSFVFSLALCVVVMLSLYVCCSCYYHNFVLHFSNRLPAR